MPRGKPKAPPLVLRIETLSDGAEVAPPMVDDFTGQAIPVVQSKSKTPAADAQEQCLADRRRVALEKRLILEHIGMLPKSLEYEQARGKAIKHHVLIPTMQVHSKHQTFEMTFPKAAKPWRRV